VLRPRVAVALDWVALCFAVAAVAIAWTGGFYTVIGGVRISARNADRTLLLAAIAFGLRRAWLPHVRPFGVDRPEWQRWRARLFRADADSLDRPKRPAWSRAVLAVLGILVFGAALLHRQLLQMDSVPDLGDPLFSMWRMGWLFEQLRGDSRPLFGGNIFYPEPLALTYSDSMLLPSLTAAPLLAAGIHPVYAYNILFLTGFAFSATATYLLVDRLTGSSRAAFISALLYGFYPYRFEHYSHLELQMTHWMPITLLWLHSFVTTLKLRYALLAALGAAAQLYSAMYYGVFFLFYATAVVGTLLVVTRPPWRRLAVPAAAAVALAAALAVPLARPYIAAQGIKGERDELAVRFYSAGPSDYFRPHPRSATYGGRLLEDKHPERALFPGTLSLVLPMAGLVPPLGTTRLAYAAGLVTSFDLSLGFNGLVYKHLYQWLLPFRGLRVPARMSVVLAISLAVLSAFGVRRLLGRFKSEAARTLVFAALVLGVAVDLRPALDLRSVWFQPPPIYGTLAGRQNTVLAEFPTRVTVPDVTDGVPSLYFSFWHWTSVVNGYSGFTPPSYAVFLDEVVNFPARPAIDALKRRGVTHVTVNCALYSGGCDKLLEKVDESQVFRQVVSASWEGQPVRLYELIK
jgi:hypothetical protein